MTAARPILTVDLRYEEDVVTVRQRARQVAARLGFATQDQTEIATAVSEVVRNAFRYAGGGQVAFLLRLDQTPQAMIVRTIDTGPGIGHLDRVMGGQYVSKTGLGLGLLGAKRLCDEFDVDTAPGRGTTVTLVKHLPERNGPAPDDVVIGLVDELARHKTLSPLQEAQQQNKELMHTLDQLRIRQAEVERLNAELAETNRGVVALYAELDDRAESLRRASEYKSRFLSDMTHELRTPLNAVISLSRLLLDRVDGDLTPEQETQVTFINRSASSLGESVNDLLDLSRIEAGKTEVRAATFSVNDVLAALRGMFRPLSTDDRVSLQIEDAAGPAVLNTDERKLTQILRNLISNALKFTTEGHVRVAAESGPDGTAVFTVSDTGIGIAPDDQERVFEDFTQIDSGVQRRVRGTGLGLPLARKLTGLLGGTVTLRSTIGVGSTFTVTVPFDLPGPSAARQVAAMESLA